jgi:succinyl-CoA:acetate CoA-transferase
VTSADDRIGTSHVSFDPSKLIGVVETDRRDQTYEFRDATRSEQAIATNLQAFLETEVRSSPLFSDTVHFQVGVGSLGNTLMGALGEADFGDRSLVYFGEVIQDGLLDLIEADELVAASATSLALSTAGQRRLFENVEEYAETIVLRSAKISNNPALIDRFGVLAINSALEIDIFGHVNSTHIDGSQVVNGIGGSADFSRHSPLSIVALPSTVSDPTRSRVVPVVSHTDQTEHDVDVVVTEHGVADLRGTSPRERATRIIESCSHPDFRSHLREYVSEQDGNGHIPHDLDAALDWQDG